MINSKEQKTRILERFAISSRKRPNGNLVWIHAASVGESMLALTLINILSELHKSSLSEVKHFFLITTATISAEKVLKKRLPINALHQFLPIDNWICVKIFLIKWKPNLGIFIESELWPCIIHEASKICPLLLVNARISDKSMSIWKKFPRTFISIVSNFTQVIVQSDVDLKKFNQLGLSNIINLGNLKFASEKLNVDTEKLKKIKHIFRNKKIVLFASTHIEDESFVLNIIKSMKKKFSDCYFIIVPRHPDRVGEVIESCLNLGLSFSIRSKSQTPLEHDDIYIIDTLGELGLFFSIAYIVFIGGSLKRGGHNPIEPAYFGRVIIFGPDMSNFYNIAQSMLDSNAAIQVNNTNELLDKLEYFFSIDGYNHASIYQKNSMEFVFKNQEIKNNYIQILKKYTYYE